MTLEGFPCRASSSPTLSDSDAFGHRSPNIFCLCFYRTNKMDFCPPGAGNICTGSALAPNPRSCFCVPFAAELAEAQVEQPGVLGCYMRYSGSYLHGGDKSPWQQPAALHRRPSHGGHQPEELHPPQPHNELFTGLGCRWEEPRRAEEEERQTQCERDALGGRLGFGTAALWTRRGLKRE